MNAISRFLVCLALLMPWVARAQNNPSNTNTNRQFPAGEINFSFDGYANNVAVFPPLVGEWQLGTSTLKGSGVIKDGKVTGTVTDTDNITKGNRPGIRSQSSKIIDASYAKVGNASQLKLTIQVTSTSHPAEESAVGLTATLTIQDSPDLLTNKFSNDFIGLGGWSGTCNTHVHGWNNENPGPRTFPTTGGKPSGGQWADVSIEIKNAAASTKSFYEAFTMHQAENFDQLMGTTNNAKVPLAQMRAKIQSLDLSQVRYKAGDQPMLFCVSGEALKKYSPDYFAPGRQFSGPAQIQITGTNTVTLEGAMLLTSKEVFLSDAEVLAKYPKAMLGTPATGTKLEEMTDKMTTLTADRADGVFRVEMGDQTTSMKMSGGPFSEGWSDDAKRKSLGLDAQFNAFCAGETAWMGLDRAKELAALRRFRDEILLTTPAGKRLADFYYETFSPWAKGIMRERPDTRPTFRLAFDAAATVASTYFNAKDRSALVLEVVETQRRPRNLLAETHRAPPGVTMVGRQRQ